jgi:beta-glucosidase
MVNERTLRDLYARGFEIAVKEAQPHCLMSSYNLLNGIHTSERRDLLETMLRGEWGYCGMVMSDYLGGEREKAGEKGKYRKFASAQSVKAGNDLMMPGGKAHYENILAALRGEDEKCTLTRQEVETCAARNIELAWKVG